MELRAIPLYSHARYRREEILAAIEWASLDRKPYGHAAGVVWSRDTKIDALFVTVHKDEGKFSPTTMYRDFPMSRDLFHWESQNSASSKTKMQGFTADGHLSPVVRSRFACCFDYPAVLHGDIDFIHYTNIHPWDHLAGSLMVTENGGVSRTMDGLAYNVLNRSRGLLVAGDVLVWMTAQQYWKMS